MKILDWYSGATLYEDNSEKIKETVEAAVASGASLDRASLDGARLDGARLDRARLDGASLVGASLDGARLDRARLVGASLDGARLVGASLVGARLDGARLVGASLDRARLDGASLDGASLDRARLVGARLDNIRADFWAVLMFAPKEIPALRAALVDGRVDGTVYEGDCACLVGTIANARHCNYRSLGALVPDSDRPAERWFTGIRKGDTPEKSELVKITVGWLDEFAKLAADFNKPEAALAS